MAKLTIDTDKIKKGLSDTAKAVKNKAADAGSKTGEVAGKVLSAGKSTIDTLGEKAKGFADVNGDGKVDMDDVLLALNGVYDKSVDGIPKVSQTVEQMADEYLNKYPDPKKAAQKLINNAITKCSTSGFLTGLGGLITLPVTVPTDLATTWYVQLRMIAAVAHLAGLDVRTDEVRTLSYACLAGVSVSKLVKEAGIATGTKVTAALVKKIPGKAMTAINKKVGFRFITKAGEKGVVNVMKLVPFVGGVIGAGLDFAETKVIANRSIKQFFDGDFTISSKEENDGVVFEVTEEDVAEAEET